MFRHFSRSYCRRVKNLNIGISEGEVPSHRRAAPHFAILDRADATPPRGNSLNRGVPLLGVPGDVWVDPVTNPKDGGKPLGQVRKARAGWSATVTARLRTSDDTGPQCADLGFGTGEQAVSSRSTELVTPRRGYLLFRSECGSWSTVRSGVRARGCFPRQIWRVVPRKLMVPHRIFDFARERLIARSPSSD